MNSAAQVFTGEFTHTVDTQRRVSMPRAWRHDDADAKFYLLPGKERMIQVIPHYVFQDFVERLRKVSFMDPRVARLLASIGAQVQEVSCDKQGRIALTAKLKEHAGINEEAIMVGAITTGQIWAKEHYQSADEVPYDVLNSIFDTQLDLGSLLGGKS